MADIIILGAGATGLSVAYHLEKNGFFDYHIFERDQTNGGLCRTVSCDGFKFDYTGHLLHINNEYVRQFFDELVGHENFQDINRRAFVYSQDTYTHYPYQMNLHGLPVSTIAECVSGFITRKKHRSSTLFYDWVMHHFGAGFGKHFFFPYQRKIFAYPVRRLSSDWTGGFVPRTSLNDILEGAINDHGDTTVGYNAQFLYPKNGGIELWIKALQTNIKNPIHTNHEVIKIDLTNKTVLFKNGHSESYKTLLSTLPLDVFLQKIHEPAHSSLKKNHKNLRCTSIINFNLGIARNNLSDKHWVYVPEKKYPFYRLGFCHNFSPDLVPPGCSSLYGEIAHRGLSAAKQQDLYERSVDLVSNMLGIAPSDIIAQKKLDISHGYVIYDTWRTKNIAHLLKTLEALDVYSCGRYGAWKYSSMQDAILDGKNVAESILLTV